MIKLELTNDEVLFLEGKSDHPEIVAAVQLAKSAMVAKSAGLSESEAAMVAKIIGIAKAKRKLTASRVCISQCPCCGRSDGYYAHARSGKYHRRGDADYSNPRCFYGIDLDQGFVVVKNNIFAGMCESCEARVLPVLRSQLAGIEAEIPEEISGEPKKWKLLNKVKCQPCGWIGHEREMKELPAIMGGTYNGECPQCGARNMLFNTKIETLQETVLVALF